jgi:hypothetical protein
VSGAPVTGFTFQTSVPSAAFSANTDEAVTP